MQTLVVTAPAIECGGCAGSIQRSLGKLDGVDSVQVEIDTKQVTVKYDSDVVNESAIRSRLEAAGFPASEG